MLDPLCSCQRSASSHYSPSLHISLFIPRSLPLVVFHSVTHTHTHTVFLSNPSLICNSFCSSASPDPLGLLSRQRFLQLSLTVTRGYDPIESDPDPRKKKRTFNHILWNLHVLSSTSWETLKSEPTFAAAFRFLQLLRSF